MRCFYFGCIGESGHYLWSRSGSRYDAEKSLPFCVHILDAGLLNPNAPQVEGLIRHVIIEGWTIMTFWDRSVDRRPRSNSAFVVEGALSFAEAFAEAQRQWPEIMKRFQFHLTEE